MASESGGVPPTHNAFERTSAFVQAMTSLHRGPGAAPTPGSLDVAYDKLVLEQRLFDESARTPNAHIYVKEFRLERRIGSGGMGSVYLAWSPQLKRQVAIKVLHDFEESPTGARALQEAHCLARVSHPNIVQVYEVDATAPWRIATPASRETTPPAGRTAMIVMEYVDGRTLEDWLASPRPWRAIVDAFLQVAHGLAAAHRCGLLHCDVTPRNVLVRGGEAADQRGESPLLVKLIDFGLSRSESDSAAESGPNAPPWAPELRVEVVSGTPGYAAPEQLYRGNRIDARCDVFGLCASMWHSLATEMPYDPAVLRPGVTVEALTPLSIRRRTWPRRLPGWLCDLLIGGLGIDPSSRPANMTRLLRTIERRLARRQAFLRWLVAPLASVLTAAAVAFMIFYKPAPVPFRSGDAGIEVVWDRARQDTLTAAVAGDSTLQRHWPELLHAIGVYVDAWQHTRDLLRAGEGGWSHAMLQSAGVCLLEARGELGQILDAIADSAAAPPTDPFDTRMRVHRWLIDLRPPTACRIRHVALNHAVTQSSATNDPQWREHYAAGYQHFLEHRLDDAAASLDKAMLLAAHDPVARARIHFRYSLVDAARSRRAAALANLHDALRLTASNGDDFLRLHTLKQLVVHADDPLARLGHYADARGLLAGAFADDPAAVRIEAGELHTCAAMAVLDAATADRFERCPIDCIDADRALASCAPGVPDEDRAFVCAEDLLGLVDQVGAPHLRSLVARSRAEILLHYQEVAGAERLARTGIRHDDPQRPDTWLPALHETLGRVLLTAERVDDAAVSLRQALTALTARGEADQLAALNVLRLLAGVSQHQLRLRDAVDYGERARQILERQDPRAHVPDGVEIYGRLAELYLTEASTQDDVRGIDMARRCIAVAQGVELTGIHAQIVVQTHILLAQALLRRGEAAEAAKVVAAGAELDARDSPEGLELRRLAAELDEKNRLGG